jgi:hypothetical protein
LIVVVPESQWLKYEEWLEKTEVSLDLRYFCGYMIDLNSKEESHYLAHPLTRDVTLSPVVEQQHADLPVEESIMTSKRVHQHSDSVPISVPSNSAPSSGLSLPHKKLAASRAFCTPSPDHEGLKQALRIGRTVNLNFKQCKPSLTSYINFC